jgi:hypothetical protein
LAPILQGGLPTSGIVRTLPHTLVYGTTRYQGLGLPSLYTEQGISHITKLLQHGAKDNITGQLLRSSLEALQLELGTSAFPLELQHSSMGFLATPCWIVNSWKFMSNLDIKMTSPSNPQLPVLRERDQLLMDILTTPLTLSRDVLLRLNVCRIYLQAVSLADIVTADGARITSRAWHGQIDPSRPSSFTWPTQQRPPDSDWKLWQ